MAFILAIEPDRRQASRVSAIAHERLQADLVIKESTDEALEMLAERVPDLILTSFLLSPRDGARLADRLRELDAAGNHVQTLVIPLLASAGPSRESVGLLTKLRRGKKAPVPEGCDPEVFAAQIAEYLDSLDAERQRALRLLDDRTAGWPARGLASDTATHGRAADPVRVPQEHLDRREAEAAPADEKAEAADATPSDEKPFRAAFASHHPEVSGVEAISEQQLEGVATPVDLAGDEDAKVITDIQMEQSVELIAADRQRNGISDEDERQLEPIATEPVEDAPSVASAADIETPPALLVTEPPPFESDESEDAELFDLANERWEDIGFAPATSSRGAVEVTTLIVDAVNSGEGGLILSAEPIDLAAFVADLDRLEIRPFESSAHALSASVSGDDVLSGATLDDGSRDSSVPVDTPSDESATPDTVVRSKPGTEPVAETARSLESLSVEDGPAASQALVADSRVAEMSPADLDQSPPAARVPPAPPSPELLQMLAAIRRDLELMRTDAGDADSGPTPSSPSNERRNKARSNDGGTASRSASKHAPSKAGGKAKRKRNKRRTPATSQDEWGFFDPEQCGFAALIVKLQEVSNTNETISAAAD